MEEITKWVYPSFVVWYFSFYVYFLHKKFLVLGTSPHTFWNTHSLHKIIKHTFYSFEIYKLWKIFRVLFTPFSCALNKMKKASSLVYSLLCLLKNEKVSTWYQFTSFWLGGIFTKKYHLGVIFKQNEKGFELSLLSLVLVKKWEGVYLVSIYFFLTWWNIYKKIPSGSHL